MKMVLIGDAETFVMAELSIRIRWPNASATLAITGSEGLLLVKQVSPDLVFMNTALPDMSFARAMRVLRQLTDTPTMVLGGGSKRESQSAMQLGADDYVRVPFDVDELMARVWAVLRRFADTGVVQPEETIFCGQLSLDPATCEAHFGDQSLDMTFTEVRLLYYLAKGSGTVISHESLGRSIWGIQVPNPLLIKKYVLRLQEKLEYATGHNGWIGDVHGAGYRFMGPKPEVREPEPQRRFSLNKLNLDPTASEWTAGRVRRF